MRAKEFIFENDKKKSVEDFRKLAQTIKDIADAAGLSVVAKDEVDRSEDDRFYLGIERSTSTGQNLDVYTPTKSTRERLMDVLLNQLPQIDQDKSKNATKGEKGGSSIGHIRYDGWKILIKPANMQGDKSAGKDTESFLLGKINEFLNIKSPLNVIIKGGGKTFEMKNITSVQDASKTAAKKSKDEARKINKSDITFIADENNKYEISIKKVNADMWESTDTYFAKSGRKIVEKLLKDKLIALYDMSDKIVDVRELNEIDTTKIYTIFPNVAVKATDEEKAERVFGNDIDYKNKKGCVVIQTFSSSHFKLNEQKGELEITADKLILDPKDLTGDLEPWFIIRNDKDRAGSKILPGIRSLLVVKSRVEGEQKQVLFVDDHTNEKLVISATNKNKFFDLIKEKRIISESDMNNKVLLQFKSVSSGDPTLIKIFKYFRPNFPYTYDTITKSFIRPGDTRNYSRAKINAYFEQAIFSKITKEDVKMFINNIDTFKMTVSWHKKGNTGFWVIEDDILNYFGLYPERIENKDDLQYKKDFNHIVDMAKHFDDFGTPRSKR